MASSPFYQKLGPGGVLAIFLTARERDLPFMSCLNGGLHSVEGKITFSALMIDAMIMKAGHKTELLYLDSTKCTVRFTRGDRKTDPDYKPLDFTYTIEDARIAGYLTKNNWKQNPKPMLYSRCITGGGRIAMAEVLMGVLVDGELVGTTSDGDIAPQIPEYITKQLPETTESVEPLLIECQKHDNYDDFIEKHQIVEGTKEMEYIEHLANRLKKTTVQTINKAIANEEGFLNSFKKWSTDRENQPTT